MKGIILAGGAGTRLYPTTLCISKQLLPVYDKPMVFYPLSTLMLAGIRDILIISTRRDLNKFQELLGNGERYGISLSYKVQEQPNGIAESFLLAEEFIGSDDVCLVLGDNIFYGESFTEKMSKCVSKVKSERKSLVFSYQVKDPERYGVVEFDRHKEVISIEEKPSQPKSNHALVGLYFFTNDVVDIAKRIKPSARGELEITSVMTEYLDSKNLLVETLGRGFAWLDTGTHDSLMEASNFIQTIEKRQGLKVACLEEIAYTKKFITKADLESTANEIKNIEYKDYILQVVARES